VVLDPQECFTEVDEDRYMEDSIGVEVEVLDTVVNTKNWYRKGTDLWAEFGKEMPFGRKISSKDSVKMLAVGSTPSFGRGTVCA
jgi:CO dehydrogenase nickel-insertion accessory protein CooC1